MHPAIYWAKAASPRPRHRWRWSARGLGNSRGLQRQGQGQGRLCCRFRRFLEGHVGRGVGEVCVRGSGRDRRKGAAGGNGLGATGGSRNWRIAPFYHGGAEIRGPHTNSEPAAFPKRCRQLHPWWPYFCYQLSAGIARGSMGLEPVVRATTRPGARVVIVGVRAQAECTVNE
jgi:hypothetical protein